MSPDAKRFVLGNTKKYFEGRGQELAARLTSLIDLLAQLEEGPSGEQLGWYQFICRTRRWWNQERIAKITREIQSVRNDTFENACALTHLFTDNIAPALEILSNDERKLLSEKVTGSSGDQQGLIHNHQGKILHIQELQQCLKSIA